MKGPNLGKREARDKDQLCIHIVHLLKSRKWMNTPKPFPEKVQGWNVKFPFTDGNRKKEDPELKRQSSQENRRSPCKLSLCHALR